MILLNLDDVFIYMTYRLLAIIAPISNPNFLILWVVLYVSGGGGGYASQGITYPMHHLVDHVVNIDGFTTSPSAREAEPTLIPTSQFIVLHLPLASNIDTQWQIPICHSDAIPDVMFLLWCVKVSMGIMRGVHKIPNHLTRMTKLGHVHPPGDLGQ